MTGASLLVNFVYCHPVGHAIEALHYCHGYHVADTDLRIGLALNAATATELASLCGFVDEVHAVEIDAVAPGGPIESVPARWDLVVDDARGHRADQRAAFPGLTDYYDRAGARFRAAGATLGTAGASPPPYVAAGESFRLRLPAAASERAADRLRAAAGGGPAERWPRIALLPAGSGPSWQYPSLGSWRLILGTLVRRWPDAQVCLIGKLASDGRTTTSFGRAAFDELVSVSSGPVDAVDLPLVDQLALVERCDVLVSPHSGFGMAALAAGTPWLSIAGGRWPEYYFNGVPFYSVLPDPARYPAYRLMGPDPAPVDDDGPRAPSMCAARIRHDLDEIAEGAARLVERRWPYEQAMRDHFARMVAIRDGRSDLVLSIDGVHRRYID